MPESPKESTPKGIRQARLTGGKDVGIGVYTHKHVNGVILTYKNTSKNKKLIEKVSFNMRNCKIVGFNCNSLSIELVPGETDVIVIEAVNKDWSFAVNSCRYGIVDVGTSWKF